MRHLCARRAAWRLSAVLLVLALLATSLMVAGDSVLSSARSALPARLIDWAHPVRVPGPGMALSGVGSDATGDILTPQAQGGKQALAIRPSANFPSVCYHGTAYHVWVLGHDVWAISGSSLKAYATYLWCPRWAGDAIGLNFTYARSYVITSGCRRVGFGEYGDWGWVGAVMAVNQGYSYVEDGETGVAYTVCQGSYGWDYSLTVPGNGLYSVGDIAFDVATHTRLYVWSPCCY